MIHIPSDDTMDVFDVAQHYRSNSVPGPSHILAGKDYGSGSSRDWPMDPNDIEILTHCAYGTR